MFCWVNTEDIYNPGNIVIGAHFEPSESDKAYFYYFLDVLPGLPGCFLPVPNDWAERCMGAREQFDQLRWHM